MFNLEYAKFFLSSQTVEVYSVTVDCTVAYRFAHTVMTSTALNKANTSQEIFFEVELPKTAFISNFSMSVTTLCLWLCLSLYCGPLFLYVFVSHRKIDGRVYVGEVKEKENAKKVYEKAISSGKTAGLVKYVGLKDLKQVAANRI